MQLLVSVRDPQEAEAAVTGGADIVDAKDPDAGALGAVSPAILHAIVSAVGRRRPITAALGDADDERSVERRAETFVGAGVHAIKLGLAGVDDRRRAAALIGSAIRGAGRERVVAVAYADHERAGSLSPREVLAIAAAEGLAGILLDTADKHGPGLAALVPLPFLTDWVAAGRAEGLLVAIAGKLTAADIAAVQHTGADIAGVRGAACDGGRLGRIAVEQVRLLKGVVHVGRADSVEGRMRTDA